MASDDQIVASASAPRIASIDALRGFDMFWIIGGDAFATAILNRTGWSRASALSQQLEHVEWEGFRFYDLIFPLFLFLVGCVLPYSLEKYREQPTKAYWRVLRRTALLVLLGLISNNLLQFDWPNLRIAGVLQRIGICYGVAGMIVLHTRWRAQAATMIAILIGYWVLLGWAPMLGGMQGDFSKEGNLAGYVDRNFLPGKILTQYYGYGDNEGILSTIPAVATTLLGVLAGHWLRSSVSNWRKAAGLFVAGGLALALGRAWWPYFPVIKNIWTSSFVLIAGGWSFLLLGSFFVIIDVLGWRKWSFPFIVIGSNAITIYVAQRFIDFRKIAQFFLGGMMTLSTEWGPVLLLAGILLAKWLFLWFLYRHKVFLRV